MMESRPHGALGDAERLRNLAMLQPFDGEE